MSEHQKQRMRILQDRLQQLLMHARVKLDGFKGGINEALVPEFDSLSGMLRESLEVLNLLAAEMPPAGPKVFPAQAVVQKGTDSADGKELKHSRRGKQIQVMLVDDHAVMRQGLSELLSDYPDIQVTGEAADGEEAIQMAREIDPDVILMDISMPRMNGIEATRIIHDERPRIRIIGLSMFDAADQAAALKQAGATDYLRKSGDKDQLIEAIRRAKRAA